MEAAEIASLIRRGKLSSREAVRSCLDRLQEVDPAINAITLDLEDEALAAADEADRALRRGDAIGPLHGVPMTTKCNIDQRGCPTDNGIIAHKSVIAAEDNPVVANMRRSGGVIFARTNTPGYSMRWFTENDLHGLTLNPWDPARTCGGSSGGAAAAVAAGIGPIAHGNDIAGSVRYPAYCCGLVGMRATYGRVPSFNATGKGPNPISSQLMAVQGPLTRTVRDNRLAFQAMAVPDPRDPRCVDLPFAGPAVPRRAALVPNPVGRGVHPAIADAVNGAGKALEAAGYIVEEAEPPAFAEAAELWPKIAMEDVIASLEPLVAENGDQGIKTALGYWRAIWPRRDLQQILDGLARRLAILRLWQQFLEQYPVVITPVSAELPFELGRDVESAEATAAIIAAQLPMLAVSVLGLPGLSVPTGTCDGIPVGVQIIAGRYREDLCYQAGEVIESHLAPRTPIEPRPARASA
jgi:amidase